MENKYIVIKLIPNNAITLNLYIITNTDIKKENHCNK